MSVKDEIKQYLQSAGSETQPASIRESESRPGSKELYWELLEDPHEKTRNFAINHLADLAHLDTEKIREKLCHHHWYVKCAVLNLMGKRKDSLFLENLIPLFQDRNAEVRKTAAWVLGEIGGKECVKLLMQLIRDENRFVRAEAERAVEKASRLKFT